MSNADYRKELLDELAGVQGKALSAAEDAEMDDLAGDGDKIDELISVLNDTSSSGQAKKSALAKLHAISIFSPVLPNKMPAYVNALRGLLKDEDAGVRTQAFGTLAKMKDHVAQEILQGELGSEKPEGEKLVPTHQAIAMLGNDSKALDYNVLRKIAKSPPSKESLVAAIRHLPADSTSFPVLQSILEDESSPNEARSLVPEKINNVDPHKFLESVNKILKEKGAADALAPILARGVGGIRPRGADESSALTSSSAGDLDADIQKTKALFKELLTDSTTELSAAAKEYLFWDEEDGK